MSLKTLVNSADWEEVEAIIQQQLMELALDFPDQTSQQAIALHALANKKAHKLLTDFLTRMEFFKGEERPTQKRNFQ